VVSISEGCVYEMAASRARTATVTEGGPSGLTEGHEGLYVAQMGSRSIAKRTPPVTGGVQVITHDGVVSWITTDPISASDLCFGPDGLLYVTDPTRQQPWVDGRLWRCDPRSGETQLLRSVDWYPNGVGFGLEDDCVYVAAMSRSAIIRFPVLSDGLGDAEVFARLPYGMPDGFAFDTQGNMVVGAISFTGGVDDGLGELQVFDREGTLLDRLRPGSGSRYTNLVLDAAGTAYVTSTPEGEVLEIAGWARPGLPLHPFRGLR
jgi:gluconolactonase